MSNPDNKFSNFFNNPQEAMKHFPPSGEQVIEAMVSLIGFNPFWYQEQMPRMMMCRGIARMKDIIVQEQKETGKIVMDVVTAAFLTTVTELLLNTRDQFASPEEIEDFPYNPDEDDSGRANFDSDEE